MHSAYQCLSALLSGQISTCLDRRPPPRLFAAPERRMWEGGAASERACGAASGEEETEFELASRAVRAVRA